MSSVGVASSLFFILLTSSQDGFASDPESVEQSIVCFPSKNDGVCKIAFLVEESLSLRLEPWSGNALGRRDRVWLSWNVGSIIRFRENHALGLIASIGESDTVLFNVSLAWTRVSARSVDSTAPVMFRLIAVIFGLRLDGQFSAWHQSHGVTVTHILSRRIP